MKSLNETLLEQNNNLQTKLRQLNSSNQSQQQQLNLANRRQISSSTSAGNLNAVSDLEVKRLRRQIEELQSTNQRLENEKCSIENSYGQLRKEMSKSTPKVAQATNPGPSGNSDQSSRSLLSLTNMLGDDATFMNSAHQRGVVIDETMKITKSLEALDLKNNELQAKVQNLMDVVSSGESDANTTKNSDDFYDFKKPLDSARRRSQAYHINIGDDTQLETIDSIEDENSNIVMQSSLNDTDDRLMVAMKNAQSLLKSHHDELFDVQVSFYKKILKI